MKVLIRDFYGKLICPRLLNNAVKLSNNCRSGLYFLELFGVEINLKNADDFMARNLLKRR